MGKATWKPLELHLSRKIVKQKQYHVPGGISEISATIKDLKDLGVVIPTTSSHPHILIKLSYLACAETNES